jgi:hypothetical protein
MVLSAISEVGSRAGRLFGALAFLVSVAACETVLAPDYDPALVAGFNQANQQAFTLFSAVSGGSPAGAYRAYAEQYDGVIGAFDALRLQAEARPVPELPGTVTTRVCDDSEAATCSNNPTPLNLAGLSANLSLMKARHASAGLSSGYVQLRRIDHEIYAANVLAVEEYLKRE